MTISLLIHLRSQVYPKIDWATFDSKGNMIASASDVPLDEIAIQTAPLSILLPSSELLLTTAEIPSKQTQRIIQAIPYALEEQFIEDVDTLHFAIGERDTQTGKVSVAAIAHPVMENYLQLFKTHHWQPVAVIPDVLAVPKPTEGWGIMFIEDMALVRTDSQTGFAMEFSCLLVTLQAALLEQPAPQKITIFNGSASPLIDLQQLGIPLEVKNHEQGTLAWFAQELAHSKPLNLLQGHYRPVNKWVVWSRPWRLTMLLLVLWGGLYLGKQIVEYHQLKQQRQTLLTQMELLYRETFPESSKVVNPRVQMEQKLEVLRKQQTQSGPSEVFLTQLTQLSSALASTPDLEVKQIEYRSARFEVRLEMNNLQTLEKMKRQLRDLDFSVEMHSANSRNNRVEVYLRILKSK